MRVAADLGNVDVVETLLKAGCDLKAVDKVTSWTSLCAAAMVAENALLAGSLEQQHSLCEMDTN